MRKFWAVSIFLALVAVVVLAQAHSTEKKASDVVTISQPVRIGNTMLQPGKYNIACDRNEMTFTRLPNNEKVVLPCKGKEMERKAEFTEMHTSLGPNGVRVVEKLLLRGSNVEHVF